MSNSTFHFVVIDDDTVSNSVCIAAIKSATDGASTLCFTNPLDGLHYMEREYLANVQNTPTIVFLDLNMPQMNGWEWLYRFEQLPQTIKQYVTIYILSSSVNPKDFEKADA